MSTLRVTFAACCAALSTLAVAQGPAGSAPPLWELGVAYTWMRSDRAAFD
jgi:hypothetical protein